MKERLKSIVYATSITLSLCFTSLVSADDSTLVFSDIAPANNMTLSGILNESMAFGDYDNDGDEDLFLTVDGQNHLFRNDGAGNFIDVTAATGLDQTAFFSVGAAFGDLDNDGDLDLYVVNFNSDIADELYRNDGPIGQDGEYVFTDIALASGITNFISSRGVTFLDYDQDGLLDIYVNSVIPEGGTTGDDIFYHNLGNLQFEDIALNIGLDNAAGMGVGATNTDVNNDNLQDIFTGNRSDDINALYLNNGDGTFTDIAEASGIVSVGLGMGVMSFDYDNDLDWDLYWTAFPGPNLVPNALYENQFTGTGVVSFVDVAAASGTEDLGGWGIGSSPADIDNDGWEDFIVGNGADDSSTPSVLFRNNGDGTFSDATAAIGGADYDGRGAAFADWDGDGDMDLVIAGDSGAADDTRMWRNDTENTNRWLQLVMEGTQSNRSAIGAKVTVTTDTMTRMQMVNGGGGRGQQNSLPLEFGLGQATQIMHAEVLWPSGIVQDITDKVSLDTKTTIKELDVNVRTVSCPGQNTFRAVGATPNSDMMMYSGTEGGLTSILNGRPCAGTSLDLGAARPFSRARSNGEGTVFIRKNLLPAMCSETRRFQLVNLSTCSTSDVVALD